MVIGTGPAGIAAAMALRHSNSPFEVIDVGYDLEQDIEKQSDELAKQPVSSWDKAKIENLFPPPVASPNGVERRLYFGSDFPYRIPDNLSVKTEGCTTELPHGYGGFGNVWGGAILPYNDYALKDWPIPMAELKASYANIAKYVPVSAEVDGLQDNFPIYSDRFSPLERSEQVEFMLGAFTKREKTLNRHGIEFGRARVAVDSSGGAATCRYCGFCLDGCVYGSIFNPRLLWKELERENVRVHKGFYALEFKETAENVIVTAVNVNNGSVRKWVAERVFLATGNIATARLIARSLGRQNEVIRISDSQYFFFPFFSYRGIRNDIRFTLAEMFVEVLNQRVSQNNVHVQVYGRNQIVEQTLRDLIPAPIPLQPLTDRLYIFQGFLHSEDSGHLELSFLSSRAKGDDILIRGVENPDAIHVAQRTQSLLRRKLLGFGLIPPFNLKIVPPGRSFHTGASFPMGGKHPVYSSDVLGRPAGLKRVHIVDPASFPSIVGSPITLTIMANADRIVNASRTIV